MAKRAAKTTTTSRKVSKTSSKTETVALKIIEIATRGARSPTAIRLIAMEELREGK
jgi:hypothetical protein